MSKIIFSPLDQAVGKRHLVHVVVPLGDHLRERLDADRQFAAGHRHGELPIPSRSETGDKGIFSTDWFASASLKRSPRAIPPPVWVRAAAWRERRARF